MKTWMAAGAAALLLSGTALAQGKPDILIGHIGINSGPAGTYGRTQFVMVQIAAEDVNKAGGINGSMVKVETADSEFNPAKASLRLREFHSRGAVGVVGPMSGGEWETAAPLANQIKMPAITVNASKPGITVRPWTLRLGPTDKVMAAGALKEMTKKFPNAKRIAIMADIRQASGAAAVEIQKEAAKKLGLEIVDVLEFSTATTDVSPLAIKVKNLHVDFILVNAVIPQALALAKAFVVQGVTTPVLANSFIWPGGWVGAVGEAGKTWYTWGWLTNTKVIDGNQALYDTVAPRYIAAATKDPTNGPANVANTANAYDAVLLMASILKRKGVDGNTPIEKAREALKDGFMETKEFSGLLNHKITPEGDSVQQLRLLQPDIAHKVWKFAD
jgi:branched-chain amino acid transport system substrate-binding protein